MTRGFGKQVLPLLPEQSADELTAKTVILNSEEVFHQQSCKVLIPASYVHCRLQSPSQQRPAPPEPCRFEKSPKGFPASLLVPAEGMLLYYGLSGNPSREHGKEYPLPCCRPDKTCRISHYECVIGEDALGR